MPLWGNAHASATNKPKFLPADEDSNYNRADCYATQEGWVMQAGHPSSGNGNTSADPEVLVASGGLAGATDTTGLRAPTVTSMRFVTASLVNGGSKTLTVEITWDEGITVAGSPQVVVANGNQSSDGDGNATLTYTATGSTANRKRFTNASLTFSTSDVYTLGGANITLNSGTISDTVRGGTAQAASLVLSGLTAKTKTVVAA
tara:strand:+ start:125 stop:733 length:609 start_codon:yes stop_codon:yes gene_type:complete